MTVPMNVVSISDENYNSNWNKLVETCIIGCPSINLLSEECLTNVLIVRLEVHVKCLMWLKYVELVWRKLKCTFLTFSNHTCYFFIIL